MKKALRIFGFILTLFIIFSAGVLAQDLELVESSPEESAQPEETSPEVQPDLLTRVHLPEEGWLEPAPCGSIAGTTGQVKRIDALTIEPVNFPEGSSLEYSLHVQDAGWMDYVAAPAQGGLPEENKQVEAVKIRLTGPVSEEYDLYYRAHVADFGWLDWAVNDCVSGTSGYAKYIEALELRLVKKGSEFSEIQTVPSIEKDKVGECSSFLRNGADVHYRAYCRGRGWQDPVTNGQLAGTVGENCPIEIVQASLTNLNGIIKYNTYLSERGWHTPSRNGADNGIGEAGIHIEAIQFKLDGDIANYMDVYYRAHVKNLGWLGWTKNGESAGTKDGNLPVEGYEIRLALKVEPAPGDMSNSYLDLYSQNHNKKLEAVPGVRTIKNFLATAIQPVGETLYTEAGGWSASGSAGVTAKTIGVSPGWKEFFNKQNENYNYEDFGYDPLDGLDCAGYVGWTMYNTLNTKSLTGSGEVYRANVAAENYAAKGYGSYIDIGRVTSYQPGDVISLDTHVFIVIGSCPDGSMVLVHSSPPGVMFTGTTPEIGQHTDATRLARKYMERYYPEYYRRYHPQVDRKNEVYFARTRKFVWSPAVVGDPQGMKNLSAEEVLKILYNE